MIGSSWHSYIVFEVKGCLRFKLTIIRTRVMCHDLDNCLYLFGPLDLKKPSNLFNGLSHSSTFPLDPNLVIGCECVWQPGWPDEFCEKRPKMYDILSKMKTSLLPWKNVARQLDNVCTFQINIPKVNNRPIGENSPNLVTRFSTAAFVCTLSQMKCLPKRRFFD
jgi:hypothetical protein